MKQEDAKRYAESMQKFMGSVYTTYSAISCHKHQTWAVRMYCTSGEYHHETLFPSESDLIHFLITRQGEKQDEKTMKKYIVREYRTAPDGSEYEMESYTITADEIDEAHEVLDELTGTAIDRYEIEEL